MYLWTGNIFDLICMSIIMYPFVYILENSFQNGEYILESLWLDDLLKYV